MGTLGHHLFPTIDWLTLCEWTIYFLIDVGVAFATYLKIDFHAPEYDIC